MKEQHVAWLQRHRLGTLDEFGVLGKLGPQEKVPVEPTAIDAHGVAAGDDLERSVLFALFAQRQPN